MKLSAISFNPIKPKYTDSAVAKKNIGLNNSINSTPVNLNYQPNFCSNTASVLPNNNKSYEEQRKKAIYKALNNTPEKARFELKDSIKNKDYGTILTHFGIKAEKDEKGMLTLSHFEEPSRYTFADLGINENDMFRQIKKIEKFANFDKCQATSLGNIEIIGNSAYFRNSKITSLGALKKIQQNAFFTGSEIQNLGNLETIGGDAHFEESKVTSLGKLERIWGDACFIDTKIKSLDNLKVIGQDADFRGSKVESLGELMSVGNIAFIGNSPLTAGKFKNINCREIWTDTIF